MRVRLVRMDADAGPDVGMALGDGYDLIPLALPRGDVEKTADAALTSAFEDLVLTFDQALVTLVHDGLVTEDEAKLASTNPHDFVLALRASLSRGAVGFVGSL